MANFNEAIRWTTGSPPIYLTVTYGKYRSGADMVYSVGLSISTVTGQRYFGYPIYAQIYVNGEGSPRYSVTLKNASPSQWSSNIDYNTGNFVVSNKTTGTTGLAVRLYSGSGSSRDETYYFDMGVDPAYFTSTPTLTYKSKTETSITYNWSTSEVCDNIVWHGTGTTSTTGLPGTSGTVTFSGLTANTSYSHYGTFRRQDSQLTTNSNTPSGIKTDNYPYVLSLSPTVITLGQTAIQTVNIVNPHSRQTTVYVRKDDISGELIGSATITGNSAQIIIPTTDLYQEIPNSQQGTLYYYCVYGNHTTTGITGIYRVSGSEKPIFPTSSWSYVADLTSLTNNNQKIIDGYSTVTVTVDTPASSDYYATISNYYATWGNATPQTFDGTAPANLVRGNGTSIVVLANDSRGLQSDLQASTLDVTANRILYSKPVVNTLETHRLNGIDTTVTLNATGTMFKDKFGEDGVLNTISSAVYYVKPVGSSTWSQAYGISLNDCYLDRITGEWSIQNASIHQNGQSGGFPTGSSYNIKLELYDAQGLLGYGTATSTIEDGTLARDVFKDSDGEYHEGINGLADGDYTQTIHGKVNVTGGYYLNGEEFHGGGGGGDSVPIGLISPYPASTPPHGWLLCDGSAVSRTTYKELFEVIGTSHGSGDGSTTFNLPNMPGYIPIGVDANDSNFNAAGKKYGSKTNTHQHWQTVGSDGSLYIEDSPTRSRVVRTNRTLISGAHANNELIRQDSTFDETINIVQPSIAEYYMIKAFKVSVPGNDLGDTLPIGSVIDYDGDTVPDGYEETLEGYDIYSTSEVKTNKIYIDENNKKWPVYRKEFTFSSLANSNDNIIGTISNVARMVSLSGNVNEGGVILSLPHSDYRNIEWNIGLCFNANNSQVIVRKGGFGTITGTSKVVIEYTKTTD